LVAGGESGDRTGAQADGMVGRGSVDGVLEEVGERQLNLWLVDEGGEVRGSGETDLGISGGGSLRSAVSGETKGARDVNLGAMDCEGLSVGDELRDW
jgi:hypothetical protein